MMHLPLSFILMACDKTRRAFLTSTTCVLPFTVLKPAIAVDEDRELYLAQPMGIPKDDGSSSSQPRADLEYLLPAARVGVYVYQTLAIAEQLNSASKSEEIIQKLDNLLLSPPSFIVLSDPKVTRGDAYNNLPPILGEVVVAQQKQKERKQQNVDVGFAPQFFEVGELIGERRSWNRLVKAEKAREGASEVRRALNIYTTNINFNPNKYKYSGTSEEKSKLIREDKLPTAKDVIRSDLDARDLYRNALQTSLDDAKAEYIYEKKNDFESVEELVSILKDAQRAIDKWFSFIPDEDIKQALEMVRKEQIS